MAGQEQGWEPRVIRDMLDGKLDSETLRRMQRAPKEAVRFQKVLALEQARVGWDDPILVPLQEHLFVVETAAGEQVVKCECGHVFGDYRVNWKLAALVYERDTNDGEVLPAEHAFDSDWMILREFYCPGCGVQLEVEAVPPSHPFIFSAIPDLAGLRTIMERNDHE